MQKEKYGNNKYTNISSLNSDLKSGLTNLKLVDSFYEASLGENGVNDHDFIAPQNGLYTIMAYATGNKSKTAIHKNGVDISSTFLNVTLYPSSFVLLSVELKTSDKVKIHVENHGGGDYTRQYWIYN